MSIRYLKSHAAAADFIPQAILGISRSEAVERFHLSPAADDFDEFLGATLFVDDTLIGLRNYAGHPPDTLTMYLEPSQDSVEQITEHVFQIVAQLDLPRDVVIWERSMDPDL